MKVIEYVARKKYCSRTDIIQYFGIVKNEQGEYDSSNAILSYRTLLRYLDELVKDGMLSIVRNASLTGENISYKISERLITTKLIDEIDYEKIILMLLECGEMEIVNKLQEYVKQGEGGSSLDKITENYISRIRENSHDINRFKGVIEKINDAIKNGKRISFEYPSKNGMLQHTEEEPLCVVLNRNGTQYYLYVIKKGKVFHPYIIEKMKNIKIVNRNRYDEYSEQIGVICENENANEIDINKAMLLAHEEIIEKIKLLKKAQFGKEIVIQDENDKRPVVVPVAYIKRKEKKKEIIELLAVGRDGKLNRYDLRNIEIIKVEHVDKKGLIENFIQNAWDIDIEEPRYVKFRIRGTKDEVALIKDEIARNSLGLKQENVGDGEMCFEGKVRGMNDFKSWIREHMTTCIIEEPVELREEIFTSLQEKCKRYEEIVL